MRKVSGLVELFQSAFRLAVPCCKMPPRKFVFQPGLLQAAPVVLLFAVTPALAFDTSKLGQGGSLPLGDLMPLIGKSVQLQREVKSALADSHKSAADVICSGMRFPGQWVNLGGMRVAPYTCDFGGKWLVLEAMVQITDAKGHVFERTTARAMKSASKISETNLTWKWTTEDPNKDN
jgi:hypothetical protein